MEKNQRDDDKLRGLLETLREIKEILQSVPLICDKWLDDDQRSSRSTTIPSS
jgi:hypothetical protein